MPLSLPFLPSLTTLALWAKDFNFVLANVWDNGGLDFVCSQTLMYLQSQPHSQIIAEEGVKKVKSRLTKHNASTEEKIVARRSLELILINVNGQKFIKQMW